MSGGHFEYKQYHLDYIADEIDQIIRDNDTTDWYNFPDDVLDEMRSGIHYLKTAAIYAQRIDWLVSGDDGVESFRTRLKKDLEDKGS